MLQMKSITHSEQSHKILYSSISLGAISGSCHHLARQAQGPLCPAGDWDRAAEAGGQTHKSVFHWNPHGECNTSACKKKILLALNFEQIIYLYSGPVE